MKHRLTNSFKSSVFAMHRGVVAMLARSPGLLSWIQSDLRQGHRFQEPCRSDLLRKIITGRLEPYPLALLH